ncbi:polysaccharide pyruvyl transferase family protein [Nitriliruptor alkaliphilus]|uniref:polysaccharide pyruvyl transferase family protein n=1 Tax=Nitriliruptor alkaliphilus TaxID=427918 RepID=UPI000695FF41|nr:polysaccharide pyruvyl transferase family protein [Nitriliruptor alkaliphilus]
MTAEAARGGGRTDPRPDVAAGRRGVVVAGWLGSTNLGDELLFRALTRQLRARGAEPTAISTDPAATTAVHGVEALPHLDPPAWWRAARADRRLVLGGGGLLQDESSRWNVPYHLSRVAVGRGAGARVVAVGLGGGTLHAPSKAAVLALLRTVPVGARDRLTASQLRTIGCRHVRLTADLAFSLPPSTEPAHDELVVCLRPRNVGGGWRPASSNWQRGLPSAAQLTALAARLGDLARALGLSLRFVALQADRDGPLHEAIAARVTGVDVVAVRPTVDTVLDEVARGRLVLGMRFHAAVAGLLAGRPVLAAPYSSKVAELASDAPRTVWQLGVPLTRVVPMHAEEALRVGDHHRAAELAALVARERGNGRLLDALLEETS